VREEQGRPLLAMLLEWLRPKELLIILDNCEHLVRPCAELAKQLLQAGSGVKMLASSREHLKVAGEAAYHVPALAVPGAREAVTRESLERYEAVRLFADRAVAVHPGFRVSQENCAAVAEICRRLDGIALAIELAAARVQSLSVAEIASRLDNSFRLLTGGDTTALPRQQTLRACIDWSYDLLAIPERELFRRLAVFAGGWPLEAAEAVCAEGDVESAGVMDILSRLVDRSLVAIDAQSVRYRLLDTVRQYARELLEASGEADSVRNRHLAFYEGLAQRERQEILGPHQGESMLRLDRERENLLSAHAWCAHAADGARMDMNLARATKMYWISRGLLGVGHALTVEALARPGAQRRDELRCRALFDAGQFAFFMGRYAEAQRYLEESLAIARELGDKARVAAALQPLGMASLGQGHLATARAHLEEALALARALGDRFDDVVVARATADVAVELLANRMFVE